MLAPVLDSRFCNKTNDNPPCRDSSSPEAHGRVGAAFSSRAQVGGYPYAQQEWSHGDLPMSAFPQLQREVATLQFILIV